MADNTGEHTAPATEPVDPVDPLLADSDRELDLAESGMTRSHKRYDRAKANNDRVRDVLGMAQRPVKVCPAQAGETTNSGRHAAASARAAEAEPAEATTPVPASEPAQRRVLPPDPQLAAEEDDDLVPGMEGAPTPAARSQRSSESFLDRLKKINPSRRLD